MFPLGGRLWFCHFLLAGLVGIDNGVGETGTGINRIIAPRHHEVLDEVKGWGVSGRIESSVSGGYGCSLSIQSENVNKSSNKSIDQATTRLLAEEREDVECMRLR